MRSIRLKLPVFACWLLLGVVSVAVHGQGPVRAKVSGTASEQRVERSFEAARKSPLRLHAWLEQMPKGADLHVHLSGAIYAETFIEEAVQDGMCVDVAALALVRGSGGDAPDRLKPMCVAPSVSAARALTDQKFYDGLVNSFSLRSFVPSAGVSGHDQFFATFDRFGGLKSHSGEWLDEVATRAAAQNEQYLEIMMTPDFSAAAKAGYALGWPGAGLAGLRERLLASGLKDEIAADVKEIDGDLRRREEIEHCGQADATPACAVTIRVIYQVLRAFPPEQVFAQTLLGFEVAMADPKVVGINFVQPEDAYMAMSEYHRQMLMLDYLHGVYPKVHISLHAGEIAPGMVPPDGLKFHIREAVELGHAERIGHGVDVMYEDRPQELLREMHDKHVMAEINLTSNDVILGIKGVDHPLTDYRAAGVPVSLSTDDEGVSRIDMTHEYVRAAMEFNLSYLELKKMVRTGIEHSFLPGTSLWAEADGFGRANAACGGALGVETPSAGCAALLKGSEKAAQEWELERRFSAFERGIH